MAKKYKSTYQKTPNVSKFTTTLLRAILNDPYTRGIDGHDYEPMRHELEEELRKREHKEHEELMKRHEKEQKEYFKYLATSHKRKTTKE